MVNSSESLFKPKKTTFMFLKLTVIVNGLNMKAAKLFYILAFSHHNPVDYNSAAALYVSY